MNFIFSFRNRNLSCSRVSKRFFPPYRTINFFSWPHNNYFNFNYYYRRLQSIRYLF